MTSIDSHSRQVLRWDATKSRWMPISWDRWERFHNNGYFHPDGFAPLPDVTPGKHFIAVSCLVGTHLIWVHAGTSVIGPDGRNGDLPLDRVLSADEVKRLREYQDRSNDYDTVRNQLRRPLNHEEQQEFDELRDRVWRSELPPKAVMQELPRALGALTFDDAARQTLAAAGISLFLH